MLTAALQVTVLVVALPGHTAVQVSTEPTVLHCQLPVGGLGRVATEQAAMGPGHKSTW